MSVGKMKGTDKLTAASPIVHFFLANSIENKIHICGCLGGINLSTMFSHDIKASFSSIFCISVNLTRLRRDVSFTTWFLQCSLLITDKTGSLGARPFDPTWIEAEQMEFISYNLIEGFPCSPEVVYPACYES
jgi:hypothetical protein